MSLGRYILSIKDEGDMADFHRSAGDGWYLYTRQHPTDRRTAHDHIQSGRSSEWGPVLALAETGQTLFDFDKTLIVVGEDVQFGARQALAASMAEWEAEGGNPVLIIFGGRRPFELAN